jgi:hypothetical protein
MAHGKTRIGKISQSPEEAMRDYLQKNKKKKKSNPKPYEKGWDPADVPGFKFGEGTE